MLTDVSSKKVLIVEDDSNIVEILSYILNREGYVVRAHLSGIGVPEIVADFQPDLILLDIKLPGKDGVEVSREIRKRYKIPIIFCSAHADEKATLRDGCGDAFLKKPFSMEELLAKVSEHMVSY